MSVLMQNISMEDSTFTIVDNADNTKAAIFQVSSDANTTRIITIPNSNVTLGQATVSGDTFATDLKIGRDSQNLIDFATTDNKLIFRVNNVNEVELVENALTPVTSNGVALGTSSLMWSDLFLASESVVNFDNGNVTLTHSNNTITVAGGTLATAALTATTGTFSGILKSRDATDATNTTNGSLQTDGGLSVAKSAVIGDDLDLLSDSAILSLGADSDATLTHDGTTGLTIAATPISIDSTGSLDLNSTTGDINFQDGGTNQLSLDLDGTSGEVIMKLMVDSDDFVFQQYDGTEVFRVEDNGDFDIAGGAGSSGVTITASGVLTADGRIIVEDTTDATNTTNGSLQTDGGLSVAKSAVIGDDLDLLSDSAILSLGANSDATLTHDGTTGLTIAANPVTLEGGAGGVDLEGAKYFSVSNDTTAATTAQYRFSTSAEKVYHVEAHIACFNDTDNTSFSYIVKSLAQRTGDTTTIDTNGVERRGTHDGNTVAIAADNNNNQIDVNLISGSSNALKWRGYIMIITNDATCAKL